MTRLYYKNVKKRGIPLLKSFVKCIIGAEINICVSKASGTFASLTARVCVN